jgi:flagellar basal body-associated protein FliL
MDVVNTLEQEPEKGKGGSAVVIVLIVIIVALLATIGYFAVQIFF